MYTNNNTTAIFKYAKLLLQYIISSFQWYIYIKKDCEKCENESAAMLNAKSDVRNANSDVRNVKCENESAAKSDVRDTHGMETLKMSQQLSTAGPQMY